MKSKKSLCIDICKFNGKNGWCLGCGRTKIEARKLKNLKPYDIKTLENSSWINISESSSHDSGVLIYERLSDDGISIVSFDALWSIAFVWLSIEAISSSNS